MQVLQNIPQTFYDSAEYSVEYIVHAEYSVEYIVHAEYSVEYIVHAEYSAECSKQCSLHGYSVVHHWASLPRYSAATGWY